MTPLVLSANCLILAPFRLNVEMFDGSSLEINNLRAIFGSFHSSMGMKNMKQYVNEFYLRSPMLSTFKFIIHSNGCPNFMCD